MDDPIQDCHSVVHTLCQGSPKEQEEAINTYFTPNASFTHPFCRTSSFDGSRLLIHSIFRWYKIMSPKIDLKINSVAFDEVNLILYINISQVFAIWFVPFHRSPVTLTTMLHLTQPPNSRKYYIKSQNDLYQVDQFVRFFAPWGLGDAVVLFWQFWATIFCTILAVIFAPFAWLEQSYAEKRTTRAESRFMGFVERVEEKRMRGFGYGKGNAADGVAETAGQVANGVKSGIIEHGEAKRLMDSGAEGGGAAQDQGQQQQFGNMQVIRPN
ncbi:hypothetical protein LTR36_001959 [Oleoguttula mirabilis]|uniref:SigF-like NTF2-like domain-containing protein n=1 Tax=Oleoguttula mirabilis TaxID=1507867 RepID=A0AAV9JLV9_9PEZI|nr:hypothetical protein LTR36_001959 [Oleoguttula mirabilis]